MARSCKHTLAFRLLTAAGTLVSTSVLLGTAPGEAEATAPPPAKIEAVAKAISGLTVRLCLCVRQAGDQSPAD
jgi:hypothetical protein